MDNYDIAVHGDMFFPRLYGPGELANVDGIGWTDQQGLKEGHVARFVMRGGRENWFHVTFPLVSDFDTPTETGLFLTRIEVRYWTPAFADQPVGPSPILNAAWAHQGDRALAFTDNPNFSDPRVGTATFIWDNIDHGSPLDPRFGISVSLRFSNEHTGWAYDTEVQFYSALAAIRAR
jgi:hypothetical protein